MRLVASSIPGARLVPLDTNNYLALKGEPAGCERMLEEIRAFLPRERPGHQVLAGLTRRECEILDLLARGLDNGSIAAQLEMLGKNRAQYGLPYLRQACRPQPCPGGRVRARKAGLGDVTAPGAMRDAGSRILPAAAPSIPGLGTWGS